MPSQLAPGVEVVAVPARQEGGAPRLALRTADGAYLRIETGEVPPQALLDRLTRGTDAPASGTAADGAGSGAELDRLVEAFAAAGYLAEEPADAAGSVWPAERREIRLLGSDRLTAPLAACLTAAGATPRTTTPEEVAALAAPGAGVPPAAVVWCLDGPVPPGLWEAADRLPQHGVAWLRCHREGLHFWLEPLAALPGDVTAAQLRARRLAATPAHRELAAYWSGAVTTGAAVPLTPAAAHLVAALLAADLTDWATGGPVRATLPARRRLRRVDLAGLRVTEHPVLPVPPVAAREPRPA